MGCHGGFSLDESVRRTWYDSEALLSDFGLKAGMVFIDVGCGDGFFSLLAAKIVGSTGKVYAVDTDAAAIEKLKSKAAAKELRNVHATVGAGEETTFCSQCADVVFYSMVLHDFQDPVKVLVNAKQMLKPTGLLVDLDWKQKQMTFGPPMHIRFSEDHALALIKQAGLQIETVKEAGQHHYLITAKP
jgi:ubiquinone/menaquinone biosynthesis C-methylase UbiE